VLVSEPYWRSLPDTEKRLVWMVLTPEPPMFGPTMRKMLLPVGLPVTRCGMLGSPT
jgi:hypothetical protein